VRPLLTTPVRGELVSLRDSFASEPRIGATSAARQFVVGPPAQLRFRQAQDERDKGRERKSGSLRFAGYAALFGIADGAGDTIRRGAFSNALSEIKAYPLLWQHNPAQPIGHVEMIAEDARGLRVIARLDSLDSRAADLLQRGQVDGLSFGYRARGYTPMPDGRVLEDIELLEVSLVTHPLQPRARVHLVQ